MIHGHHVARCSAYHTSRGACTVSILFLSHGLVLILRIIPREAISLRKGLTSTALFLHFARSASQNTAAPCHSIESTASGAVDAGKPEHVGGETVALLTQRGDEATTERAAKRYISQYFESKPSQQMVSSRY